MRLFLISAFGLLGVLSRYYMGLYVTRLLPPPFPYGTFLINISGAFIIGAVYVLGSERMIFGADLRIGIMVGFLGGYTTFSSYCLEAVSLIEDGQYVHAVAYFLLSPALGFLAAWGGMILMRALTPGSSA